MTLKKLWLLLAGMAVGLALTAGGVWAYQQFAAAAAPPPTLHGMLLDSPRQASDFTLHGAGGREVHLSDFRNRLVLLYFGYTFCPDVCPATLSDLAQAVKALGPQAADVQVIMVSVDPERDTPDRTAQYARSFDPDFIGLSGTLDEITAAATPFGVFFEKEIGSPAAGYTVTHTSIVTVIDRQGYVRLVWPFGVKNQDMASDLHYLLGR